MQFKVPQDVLRADKIVGFLTLRQLIIVGIGGGISYSLYIILSKQYFLEIWLPPVVFMGLITVAFAFMKFHDIVFERLVLIFIEYKFRPRTRTWQKMRGDTLISVLGQPIRGREMKRAIAPKLTERERRQRLEEAMKAVATRGKDFSKSTTPNQNISATTEKH